MYIHTYIHMYLFVSTYVSGAGAEDHGLSRAAGEQCPVEPRGFVPSVTLSAPYYTYTHTHICITYELHLYIVGKLHGLSRRAGLALPLARPSESDGIHTYSNEYVVCC